MVSEKQKEKFSVLCAALGNRKDGGVGTLGEKTLHRTLKQFLCPPDCVREVKVGDFVADGILGGCLYEIQTGGLYPLKRKLGVYLSETDYHICIVCPVIKSKTLVWVDPESGEMSTPRRTRAGLGQWHFLAELIYLLPVFDFSRMSLLLMDLSAEDYKLLDGRGKDKKIGASRYERLPVALLNIREVTSKETFSAVFLPPDLPLIFTSSDFSRVTGLRRRSLSAALKVLLAMECIRTAGKRGNAVLYEKTD